MANPFGTLGVWLSRVIPADERLEVVQAAERLGYGTVWISGGRDAGAFEAIREALGATSGILVGSSVINMWAETPESTTAAYRAIEHDFPGRFYLGAGPSHRPLAERLSPGGYRNPYSTTRDYLDRLDAQPDPVPVERRLIGAIGPQALRLAAARTLGSIPYNTVPAHTAFAREALGADAVLAPEIAVVLEPDLSRARARAREFLAGYLDLPNYTKPLLERGFTEADLADGGSDRLVEGLFGTGTVDSVVSSIDAHLSAGADHVAVQVLPVEGQSRVDVLARIAEERGM